LIADTRTYEESLKEAAMAMSKVTVKLTFANPKCVRALRRVLETLEDLAEDFAYRDDVKKAVRAAKYLRNNMTVSDEKGE